MNKSKKIKAAFLFAVFSLNTVAGLACSLGFNFNKASDHHEHSGPHSHESDQPKTVSSHSHEHGDADHHSHDTGPVPPHDHSKTDHHNEPHDEGNCCSDEVIKLSMLDKAVTKTNQNPVPLFIESISIISAFILSVYANAESSVKLHPPSVRWPLATHTDLRVVIQSFQI